MKIHEYQGKDLLRDAGVPVPQSQVAFTAAEAKAAALREWAELVTAARASGRSEAEQFADELTRTKHGRTLLDLDLGDDLPRCANLDSLAVVPVQDRRTGEIRLA